MSSPNDRNPDAFDLLKVLIVTLDPRSESMSMSALGIPSGLICIAISALQSNPKEMIVLSAIGFVLLGIGFLLYPLRIAQITKLHLPIYTSFQAYLSALGIVTTLVGLLVGIFSLAFSKEFTGTGLLAGIALCALAEYLSRRHSPR